MEPLPQNPDPLDSCRIFAVNYKAGRASPKTLLRMKHPMDRRWLPRANLNPQEIPTGKTSQVLQEWHKPILAYPSLFLSHQELQLRCPPDTQSILPCLPGCSVVFFGVCSIRRKEKNLSGMGQRCWQEWLGARGSCAAARGSGARTNPGEGEFPHHPHGEKSREKMEQETRGVQGRVARHDPRDVWDGSGIPALTRAAWLSSPSPALPPPPVVSAAGSRLSPLCCLFTGGPTQPSTSCSPGEPGVHRELSHTSQGSSLLSGTGGAFPFPACSSRWVTDLHSPSSRLHQPSPSH